MSAGAREWPHDDAAEVVAEVASVTRLLIALDFDGTLAPLVDDPMSARATPEARAVLTRLAELPETWIAFVSGRSLHDLRKIAEHDDASVILLAGSHGAEFWAPEEGILPAPTPDAGADASGPDDAAEVQEQLVADIETLMPRYPGVWVERKSFGFAVAGRLAEPDVEASAFAAVDALMAQRAPAWRRRRGHNILEFASRAEGKDTAIAALRARTGADAVVFAGDDVTDEDALASLEAGDLGIRVGEGDTAARVRVSGPAGLVDLLGELADRRARRASD